MNLNLIRLVYWVTRALKSKRVWMIIGLVLLNGVPSVTSLLPPDWLVPVNMLLGLLGFVFGMKPNNEQLMNDLPKV